MEAFAAATTRSAQYALIDRLLMDWAATDTITASCGATCGQGNDVLFGGAMLLNTVEAANDDIYGERWWGYQAV